jgi:hypothetical protein
MEYRTQIPAPVARVVVRGLEELGANTSLDSFNEAVKWPCETLDTSELFIAPVEDYEIVVTPEVVSAVVGLVNGGELTCYVGSGVTSEQLIQLTDTWMDALKMTRRDPTIDLSTEPKTGKA